MAGTTDGPTTLDIITLCVAAGGLGLSLFLAALRLVDRRRRLKVKVDSVIPADPDVPEQTTINVWNKGVRPIEVVGWEFRKRSGDLNPVPSPATSPELKFPTRLSDGGGFSLYFLTDDLIDARDENDRYRWFVLTLAGGIEKKIRIDHRWPRAWLDVPRAKLRRGRYRFRAWRWKRSARKVSEPRMSRIAEPKSGNIRPERGYIGDDPLRNPPIAFKM